MNIIDVHSHILPKVDDGSEDIGMSIEMAKMYLENGIKKVIATPHYIEGSMDNSLEGNILGLERLKKGLYKEGLELEVFLGNEIYVSMDIFKYLDKERVSTLNNTRYVLLELPMYDIPLYMEDLLYEIQLKGLIPIIAHPERNTKIIENPNILYKYIEKGALAQLNLPSLENRYGSQVKSTAVTLLKHNMIHFIGTDAHTNRHRSPNVKKGIKLLRNILSQEDFNNITYRNAQNLLDNKILNIKEPVKYKAKNNIFTFLNDKIKRVVL